MGTTAEKLQHLIDTKEAIRAAIIEKGVEVPEQTTFREYANRISEIQTGGSTIIPIHIKTIEIPVTRLSNQFFICDIYSDINGRKNACISSASLYYKFSKGSTGNAVIEKLSSDNPSLMTQYILISNLENETDLSIKYTGSAP